MLNTYLSVASVENVRFVVSLESETQETSFHFIPMFIEAPCVSIAIVFILPPPPLYSASLRS